MHIPRLSAERVAEPAWRIDAQCRQRNAAFFFPPTTPERKEDKLAREAQARALCNACKVRELCLDYALTVEERYGLWGGMNELERRRELRRRAAADARDDAASAG